MPRLVNCLIFNVTLIVKYLHNILHSLLLKLPTDEKGGQTYRYPIFRFLLKFIGIHIKFHSVMHLYTRYPIVARRAWPASLYTIGRVRRVSKSILHTSYA